MDNNNTIVGKIIFIRASRTGLIIAKVDDQHYDCGYGFLTLIKDKLVFIVHSKSCNNTEEHTLHYSDSEFFQKLDELIEKVKILNKEAARIPGTTLYKRTMFYNKNY